MNDSTILKTGKHKGKALANVPAKHLIKLYKKGGISEDLKNYIEDNMDVLKQEVESKI
jgi:uncharacterized protein (DUF3820 family)